MVDPFAKDPEPTRSPGVDRARAELDARFHTLRQDASEVAGAGAALGQQDRISSASFKAQASQAANEARSAAASIAEQARGRFAEIVDQQKAAGAARIAGVARAAQTAATDLDATNPELARLVRSAAASVDKVASDVRSRDIGDVVGTLASLGRRQPVAFFGGAVLTGFLLARFFKSDAPVIADEPAGPV